MRWAARGESSYPTVGLPQTQNDLARIYRGSAQNLLIHAAVYTMRQSSLAQWSLCQYHCMFIVTLI